MFSMHVTGPCADEAGRKFVASQPSSGSLEIFPPDLFVVSPEGELLGRLAYDATADETYAFLVDILRRRPDLAPPQGPAALEPPPPSDPAEVQLQDIEARYDATTPEREWWRSSIDLLFRVDRELPESAGTRFDPVKAALVGELEAWLAEHAERLPGGAALARVLLGGARAHAGDFLGAREAWQSVLDLHPNHPLRHRAGYNLIEPGGFPSLGHPELARIPRPPVTHVGVHVPDASVRARNLEAVRADRRYLHDVLPGLPFVRIPEGTFTMGGTPAVQGRELPTRRVTITRSFLISAWPITRGLWRRFRPGDYEGPEGEGLAADLPAVQHSWLDLVEYCAFASRQAGRTFRLPTEAEWEYAARGGLAESAFPWGNEPPDHARCNYAHPRPVPVGCYPPNGYGLFDCVGNSFEWVSDYYLTDAYARTPAEIADPEGPSLEMIRASGLEATRVVRGGGWLGNEMCHINCRNAWRLGWPEGFLWCNLGARIVVDGG
jgi:formylglycine-generating enzyme required for sulfatase activity